MVSEKRIAAKQDVSEGLLLPGAVVKGYQIESTMRSGTSNNVYVAVSPDGTRVALKEYFPRRLARRMPNGRLGVASEEIKQQFESGVKAFINEAVVLAKIRSDLLARYETAFRDNGTAYIATVLEPGVTLEVWTRETMKAGRRPQEADLRLIFWTLLNAVRVMHDQGFLHLDIKPSNVVMRDENTPILIDLGGARKYPSDLSEAVSASNYTPGFAAPEQHADRTELFAPRTDIYGVGASILYCMCGKVPPIAPGRLEADGVDDLLASCSEYYTPQFTGIVKGCLALPINERFQQIKPLQNMIGSQ